MGALAGDKAGADRCWVGPGSPTGLGFTPSQFGGWFSWKPPRSPKPRLRGASSPGPLPAASTARGRGTAGGTGARAGCWSCWVKPGHAASPRGAHAKGRTSARRRSPPGAPPSSWAPPWSAPSRDLSSPSPARSGRNTSGWGWSPAWWAGKGKKQGVQGCSGGHKTLTHIPPKASHRQLWLGPSQAPGGSTYLESPVVLGDGVGEVYPLPLGQELAQLRPLLHAQVIAHEIPVNAVPPPLFEVVEDVGGCEGPRSDAGGPGLCAGGSALGSCPPALPNRLREPWEPSHGLRQQEVGLVRCRRRNPSCSSSAGFETR